MTKAIDLDKFRKHLTKNIPGISQGFNDPVDWIDTGNYTLNYRISGDFFKGIPYGKLCVFAGESGSAKSVLCSGNLVANAQKDGAFVVLIDSENALDESWLQALDVDTNPENLIRVGASQIDQVGKTISELIESYVSDFGDLDYSERPKMLFVIDSLGMLSTPVDDDQFRKGDMKGDFGRKAKMLAALVRSLVHRVAQHPICIVATNHTYASQDMFDPDDKISGGSGFIYASSIVVAMRKLKLKEDEEGKKTSQVHGIRAACKVMKSRYSKPFESVQIKIPYSSGIDPYSGLVEMFEDAGVLVKTGNRLKYVTKDGQEIIEFRKNWTPELLTIVMTEYTEAAAMENSVESTLVGVNEE